MGDDRDSDTIWIDHNSGVCLLLYCFFRVKYFRPPELRKILSIVPFVKGKLLVIRQETQWSFRNTDRVNNPTLQECFNSHTANSKKIEEEIKKLSWRGSDGTLHCSVSELTVHCEKENVNQWGAPPHLLNK